MSRARELVAKFWLAIPVLLVVALLALRAGLATDPLDNLHTVPADPRDPPGTVAHEGSLYIARGGPVIIGYLSPGPARIVIGDPAGVGKELVAPGYQRHRIVLPAGPVALRFAAPPDGRLIWNPVGRRGDPEYVPASSLSPDPPSSAQFGASVGATPLDGVIASLILLVFVGTLLALARHRLRRVSRNTGLAIGAVFVVGCVVRWLGIFAFGQTWDEDVNWGAGRNYITNLLSLDISPTSWMWNFEHPPMMKYLEGIGAQFSDGFGPARALSAMWTSLGCALLVPIGTRLYSFRVGVLAAAIAALLPPLVAHGQIVGHESPTVLWWALAILLALSVHDDDPTPRTRRIRLAWTGVAIGIAIASRFVNGLVGILCLLIVVESAPGSTRAREPLGIRLAWLGVIAGLAVGAMFVGSFVGLLALVLVARRALSLLRFRSAVEDGLIMLGAAAFTLYAVWPRLWLHPIEGLRQSLAKLTIPHGSEPFLGKITMYPGPHYFLVYLLATLPLGALLGFVAYVARAARERNRAAIIVAAWFFIPMVLIASPVRQDGVRYVMPSVLALALIAAAGWDYVVTFVEPRIRRAFTIVSAALVLYLGITLTLVHPYYLDYFGEQVGGAGTVARHNWFEVAWWGEGVDRSVDYVNEHAAQNAKVFRNCIRPYHLAWFREDLWAPMVQDPRQADWIVTYAPQQDRCAIPPDFTRVFVVETHGAIVTEVWQRTSAAPAPSR